VNGPCAAVSQPAQTNVGRQDPKPEREDGSAEPNAAAMRTSQPLDKAGPISDDFARIIESSSQVWIHCREGMVRTDTGLEVKVDTAELLRWLRTQGWVGGGDGWQPIGMWKP
jgi:hypothetical protein